jgi:RNA polymerase sigma-70 factor, ECF subfamily
MDEFALVKRCLEGDSDAYRHIVDRYKDRISGVVYSITRSKTDYEDVTQEVFIKAYRSLGTFKFESSLSTWLYRIAVNQAIDYVRKKKAVRILSLEGIEEWVLERLQGRRAEFSPVPEDIRNAETKEAVEWALAKLPDDARSILILREYEDLPYEAIADILGISESAVKSRLFRARSELKKILLPVVKGESL